MGDEFDIVLLNSTPAIERKLFEAIEQTIIEEHHINNISIQIYKDIGYAVYPEDANDLLTLGNLANLSMKQSSLVDEYKMV